MIGLDWPGIGEAVGGFVAFVALIALPAGLLFNRKVIRPLRWVLGVAAEDSPTGETVLPVPQQLAALRQSVAVLTERTEQLTANGGGSMFDLSRKTHKLAVSTDRTLRQHLTDSATSEAEIWRAIAGGPKEPAS